MNTRIRIPLKNDRSAAVILPVNKAVGKIFSSRYFSVDLSEKIINYLNFSKLIKFKLCRYLK